MALSAEIANVFSKFLWITLLHLRESSDKVLVPPAGLLQEGAAATAMIGTQLDQPATLENNPTNNQTDNMKQPNLPTPQLPHVDFFATYIIQLPGWLPHNDLIATLDSTRCLAKSNRCFW